VSLNPKTQNIPFSESPHFSTAAAAAATTTTTAHLYLFRSFPDDSPPAARRSTE